jgi:Cof subfamily protein (haloacid dehalogenase superfamily)
MTDSALDGIRLVALDLDGTLLPAHKRLTQRARDVVGGLRDAGIHVVLATGRGWTHTELYARELGLPAPHVALEGALVAQTEAAGGHRVLHRRLLPSSLIRRVGEATRDLPVGWFCCADDHRTLMSRRLEERLDQVRVWDPSVTAHDDWPDAARAGFILHLVGPPDAIRTARERIHALGLDDVEHFHAEFWDGFEQLQVRPGGIGKHTGLAHVLRELGVAPGEMLAAGDWWNDVEMLRMARVAVCPENAVPGVRKLAHHVAPGTCDDDAVIRFLDRALRGQG